MNNQQDNFIYDYKNYNDNWLIVRNKTKSNWNLRKTLQSQSLEPLKHNGPSQTPNSPHIFKSIHDDDYPIIGSCKSDLKNNFMKNERFQGKLIAPSINVNLKLSKLS
jgi:hypothetical protein